MSLLPLNLAGVRWLRVMDVWKFGYRLHRFYKPIFRPVFKDLGHLHLADSLLVSASCGFALPG